MNDEIKDVLLDIQCEIRKINEKLERVASRVKNGDYTYTSDPKSIKGKN